MRRIEIFYILMYFYYSFSKNNSCDLEWLSYLKFRKSLVYKLKINRICFLSLKFHAPYNVN